MRTKLLIASAGAALLGLAAPAFAQPATEPTMTGPTYNTGGPGMTNQSNPAGRPASGYGQPPAKARLKPADGATALAPATSRSTTGPQFTTSGPGETNTTRTLTAPSGQHYPGPNPRTAANSKRETARSGVATAPSVSRPQYNTAGPGETAAARPATPPAGTDYYSNGQNTGSGNGGR